MATKDDTESFTVEVVELTAAKLAIVGYSISPTPPITQGASFSISCVVANIGQVKCLHQVKLVDATTEETIAEIALVKIDPDEKQTHKFTVTMPSKDWALRLEAWRA